MMLVKGFIALMALMLVSTSCEKKEKEEGPALPPKETMLLDMSLFENNNTATKSTTIDEVSKQNWGTAALAVGYWNIVLYVNSVVPVMAFQESFNHEPEFLSDATWQWSYSYKAATNNYTARLTAQVLSDSTIWTMYIKGNAGPEVIWFSGACNNAYTGGYWILNGYIDLQVQPYLKIDWKKDSGTVDFVKYTYVLVGAEGYSNYLQFGLNDANANYEAYYNIVTNDNNESNDFMVECNRATREGRVKYQPTFQDENWHCWDVNLNDITCAN